QAGQDRDFGFFREADPPPLEIDLHQIEELPEKKLLGRHTPEAFREGVQLGKLTFLNERQKRSQQFALSLARDVAPFFFPEARQTCLASAGLSVRDETVKSSATPTRSPPRSRLSRANAIFCSVSFGLRPPIFPFRRAAANPALVRSTIVSRSS